MPKLCKIQLFVKLVAKSLVGGEVKTNRFCQTWFVMELVEDRAFGGKRKNTFVTNVFCHQTPKWNNFISNMNNLKMQRWEFERLKDVTVTWTDIKDSHFSQCFIILSHFSQCFKILSGFWNLQLLSCKAA